MPAPIQTCKDDPEYLDLLSQMVILLGTLEVEHRSCIESASLLLTAAGLRMYRTG